MTNKNIFAALAAIIIVGLGVYIFTNFELNKKVKVGDYEDRVRQTEPGDHPEVDRDANDGVMADNKSSIVWNFKDAGESNGIPYTSVVVVINNKSYEVGKFTGSCSEIGATGGVDGKGLLAGELSAAQCWFAGGGDEIGVFAHEDGGFDIMVGELGEGVDGGAFFRSNFKIKQTIRF